MCACTYGCPTMIWSSQFTEPKYDPGTVRPNDTEPSGLGNRERFIARPCEENKWFMTKKPQSPRKISESIFKGKFREGYPRVCDHLLHDSFIDWWWLRCQKVWGLWYSWSSNSEFLPLETVFSTWKTQELVGGQSEALRPWQRSWGRKLDIRKGGIEPQESPWKSLSIYPHNQSLPTLLLCAFTYTSDFTGGCPPPHLSEKELT